VNFRPLSPKFYTKSTGRVLFRGGGGDQVGLLAVKSEYDDLEKGLLSTKQNIENKKKKTKILRQSCCVLCLDRH
jgi:hypothetical protein